MLSVFASQDLFARIFVSISSATTPFWLTSFALICSICGCSFAHRDRTLSGVLSNAFSTWARIWLTQL